MACVRTAGDDGVVAVTGSYAAPSGPDRGWRIGVEPVGRESLRVVMHAVSPEVSPAVETTYEPAWPPALLGAERVAQLRLPRRRLRAVLRADEVALQRSGRRACPSAAIHVSNAPHATPRPSYGPW